MPPSVSFGDQLRRYRERAGLTQEQLADKAGVTAKAISALERNERRQPYPHTVHALATALGLGGAEYVGLLDARDRRNAALPSTSPSPALATLSTLPEHLTSLVGREAEVAVVQQLLQRADVRLLTLTGPGGVGKTRLALEVAAASRTTFADGVVWVALASLNDPALVVPTIAHAVGVGEQGSAPLVQRLATWLRDKELLLVIDNWEHVLGAAPFVVDLLLGCPRLNVLATSREALRVRGEQEYPVPPLKVPTVDRVSTDLRHYAAVELFVQRAQAVRPHWTLTPEHGPVVAQICARLGGLPLAIELAAARIALLNPPTLLARLEHSLQVLTSGARDLPLRQQTMRATVAWSYDLLPPGEQRLFRWLAVWAGGATLHAIEAVVEALHADPTEVLEQVEALVYKNLLVRDETTVGDERVGMLEVVRAYGREQLAAHGEVEAVQRAHAHVYCALAEEATVKLNGSGQATWFQRIDQDLNNFRAAMHVLLNDGAWEEAVRLTRALWRYWRVRGLHREARTWMEQVLGAVDLAPAGGITRMRRAQALLIVGSMAVYAPGEYDLALQRCEESWSLCQGGGDTRTEAAVLMMLGMLYVGRGAYERAQQVLEQSMALFRMIDEHWGAAFALSYLGMIPLMQGRYAEAVPYFEQGLALARAAGDAVATHQIEYLLGLAAKAQGDDTSALQHFAAGLELAVAVHDVLSVGYFVRAIAEIAIRQGHIDAGRRVLDAAVVLLHTVGASVRHVADTTHTPVDDQVAAVLGTPQGTQTLSEPALTMEQAVAGAYDLADTILSQVWVDRQAARDST